MADGRNVTIGVDIGTTSVKAVAADDDGRVVASVRIDHPVRTPAPGILEHDARLAWHTGVRRAAAEVAEEATSAGYVTVAVNVAAMVPSLCAVDAAGVPVSPGLLYGDRRAAGMGTPPRPGLNPAEDGELVRMLSWLAKEYPDAAGFWPAQAVANAALCGNGAIDTVTAMTTLPLFDFAGWDPAVCSSAGVRPGQLPAIVSGIEPAGRVPERLGDEPAGSLGGAVVAGGTIDAFAEQLVAGADHDGDVLLIMGATLITWAVIPEWHEAAGLWTVPHTAPGKSLIGGPSNAGGIARDWAAKVLLPAAPGVLPDDPGEVPVFLPHVRGERVPLHDPHRRGGFDGLSVAQGPPAVWRAVFEGAGFTVRRNLELAGLLDADGRPPVHGAASRRIVATGGGSVDDAWVHAVADATGLPVDCVAEHKGGALGSAFVARTAAGLEPDTSGAGRWARVGRRIEPDARWAEACAPRYRRFVELSGPPLRAGAPG